MDKIKKIKEDLLTYDENDDEDEDNEDFFVEDDKIEKFSTSECNCGMCKCLNNIYIRWDKFIPKSNIEKHMKKYIDSMN